MRKLGRGVLVLALVSAAGTAAGAQEFSAEALLRVLRSRGRVEEDDDDKKPDSPAFLKGLDALVATYPAEHRAGYALFRAKCSTCHNVAKSLATTDDDWNSVVVSMARKKQSGISPSDRKPISDFLNYWSTHRTASSGQGQARAKEPAGAREEKWPQWSVHGAVFLDYNGIQPRDAGVDANGQRISENEGVSAAAEFGATVALNAKVSGSFMLCYGCHQLEVDQAYGEYRFSESLVAKAGRFPVPVGAYHQRYLAAVRDTPSQPLPYIMGFMPHAKEFNHGVLPAPYTDNGASIAGSIWPANGVQMDLELYAVRGLKDTGSDLSFVESRDWDDNNGKAAFGGRLTMVLGAFGLGASATSGRYDAAGDLAYTVVGLDARLSMGDFALRAEWLRRDTEFESGGPGTGTPVDSFVKEGYYVQFDGPLFADGLRFFVVQDGLSVRGIYLDSGGPTPVASPTSTDDSNYIFRLMGGVEYTPTQGFSVKLAVERWDYSDFEDLWVYHVAVTFQF